MQTSRVSVCQGPPGTGKTVTAAHGIADLYCREGGLIMVCCPSNFASNVIYEKLVSVNKTCQVGMSITRMYSESRERDFARHIGSILDEGEQTFEKKVLTSSKY